MGTDPKHIMHQASFVDPKIEGVKSVKIKAKVWREMKLPVNIDVIGYVMSITVFHRDFIPWIKKTLNVYL